MIGALFTIAGCALKAGATVAVAGVKTVGDCCSVVKNVCDGDFDEALNVVGKRVEKTITGAVNTLEAGVTLVDEGINSLENDESFFDNEKVQKSLTTLMCGGICGAAGLSLLDDDIDVSDNDTSYIDNGTFDGDESDLQHLIAQGELENTEHLTSDEYDRSISARNEFLASHGFDSVPEGYEVHHIIPLSEGGSDTPDNMVLVSEEEHDKITAAHRDFYNW